MDAALEKIFALLHPLETETVPLALAAGRVLRAPVVAPRNQPPFPASAMDGYAVDHASVSPGATFKVIGESAAGAGFEGAIALGETVRIFTGAPVPEGANRIIIQEDVERSGDQITLHEGLDQSIYVRPAGHDFKAGSTLDAPTVLTPPQIALAAAMGAGQLTVSRRPVVALMATGDELVCPGETPGPDQIIASNSFGLKAMLEAEGALVRVLPIARDTPDSLKTCFRLAQDADLLVTMGGASVGDHDLVRPVAAELGMTPDFYKVAMRPGKPLMAGRILGVPMVGLPGNPVSTMVCGHVFLRPAIRLMLGLAAAPVPREIHPLAAAVPANGPREHYMRARIDTDGVTVFDRQDSALLSVLGQANCLARREPNAPAQDAGTQIEILRL